MQRSSDGRTRLHPAQHSLLTWLTCPAGTGGVLVWLRQDLRVHDNPTLCAAAADAKAAGGAVTIVFVHSPEEDGDAPATGGAGGVNNYVVGSVDSQLGWLHACLEGRGEGGVEHVQGYCCTCSQHLRHSAPTCMLIHVPPTLLCLQPPPTGTSWRPGAASLVWLHGALASLDADLQARYGPGAAVVYRQGPYAQALLEVASSVGAGAVYYSRRYEPAMQVGARCLVMQVVVTACRTGLARHALRRTAKTGRAQLCGTGNACVPRHPHSLVQP